MVQRFKGKWCRLKWWAIRWGWNLYVPSWKIVFNPWTKNLHFRRIRDCIWDYWQHEFRTLCSCRYDYHDFAYDKAKEYENVEAAWTRAQHPDYAIGIFGSIIADRSRTELAASDWNQEFELLLGRHKISGLWQRFVQPRNHRQK